MDPQKNSNELNRQLAKVLRRTVNAMVLTTTLLIGMLLVILNYEGISNYLAKRNAAQAQKEVPKAKGVAVNKDTTALWTAPEVATIADASLREKVLYGKDLIAHTAKYFGPQGTVQKMSNGMNCQNCHLDAGTKPWGNNYGSVAPTYPKFRARSGSLENIYKRVNDCIERSLNGKAIDTLSREMQAIKAYIEYLGSNVEKGKRAVGSGFKDLAFMDRAADPVKGKEVYVGKCQSCHQPDGKGLLQANGSEYTFPPLWGEHSYNDGAGLYRVSNFAKYVKYNMPLGVNHESTQLTNEEAWDVAAYVNSQPRPHKNVPNDWPDISKKPIDHPFGPYADQFSEEQHKYGPFKPIEAARKKAEELNKAVAKN
jgi:thiosulfate dehydrogenase